MTGPIRSTCARLAISGTTPPKRACRSTWLDTIDERTRRPSSTTAAAVSSHDVSSARMVVTVSMGSLSAARDTRAAAVRSPSIPCHRRSSRLHAVLDAFEQRRVIVAVDLVHPHHERVLTGLLVVVLAHADRGEAEAPVQELRALVRHAHLEREVAGVARQRLAREHEHQPRADRVPLPRRVDRDRRDVPVLAGEQQPRVPDDVATDPGDEVGAGPPHRELRQEERMAPGPRVHLLLDAQHRLEVAAPHGRELHGERRRHRHPRTASQPSSASLSRR